MKKLAAISGFVILIILLYYISVALSDKHRIAMLRSKIQEGDAESVSYLITKHPELLNADLESDRRDKLKPLSLAAGLGQEAICSNLLTLGADVNELNKIHYTPLHQTIMSDQTNVASLLIRHGADLTVKNNEGLTPLEMTIKYCPTCSNMIMILSAAVPTNTTNRN
jgi:ankyrin repeat protein